MLLLFSRRKATCATLTATAKKALWLIMLHLPLVPFIAAADQCRHSRGSNGSQTRTGGVEHVVVYLYTYVLKVSSRFYFYFIFFLILGNHFYFPAQLVLVGYFTLSDLLDKPWSQVSSLLPPGTCLQFLSRIGFSIPTARRFSSSVANSRSRAFR